jgi:hypothetical protein
MNEETLFHLARQKSPEERQAFLDTACAGDPALRRRIEVLLQADAETCAVDRAVVQGDDEEENVSARPAAAAPGTRVHYFGDYELLEEISRGGMGVVYKARQLSLKRTVALKMILAGQFASPDEVGRFQHEAQAAANLDHANIVPIYEIGEHDGQHYFSMKLIEGTSLLKRISDYARNPKSAAAMLAKVARAVHHAHQHGILHRDLKPGNILVDCHDEPYVTDFGLAKKVDGQSPQTRTGMIVGTPSYMAPEQARPEKGLTVAADVYGLGAILYELVTGRPPFRAETELDTILQVLDRDPPRPRTLNPRLDADLETICLKCLEKEPGKRYGSALALAEDLERWCAGRPIEARPSGPARRLVKWAKRNPTLAILLVVLVAWYFNVRIPWEWAWLDWIFLGFLVLLGLSRSSVLWRRWRGEISPNSRDSAFDVCMLPAAVGALLVMFIYRGDLADRKTVASTLLLLPLWVGCTLEWLWRRQRAGPLELAMRLRPAAILLSAAFGLLAFSRILWLLNTSAQSGDFLAHICTSLTELSGLAFLILLTAAGTEFRKNACVTFFRFIKWEMIERCEWRLSLGVVLLRLWLRDSPTFVQIVVRPEQSANVERVLLQHLPESARTPLPLPAN